MISTTETVEPAPPPETILGHRVHPAATLLPEPTAEEFQRLVADIKKNGILEPVVLVRHHDYRDSLLILDGRSRARAWELLGRDPKKLPSRMPFGGQVDDEVAYVLSMNATRRHLRPDQVAALYILGEQAKIKHQKAAAAAAQKAGLKRGKSRERHMAPTGKTAANISKATGGNAGTRTVERVQRVAKVAPERLLDVAHNQVTAAAVLREFENQKRRDGLAMGTPKIVTLDVLAAGAEKPTTVILTGKDWSPTAARDRFTAAVRLEFEREGCCREDRPALARVLRLLADTIDAGTRRLAIEDKYVPDPSYQFPEESLITPTTIAATGQVVDLQAAIG